MQPGPFLPPAPLLQLSYNHHWQPCNAAKMIENSLQIPTWSIQNFHSTRLAIGQLSYNRTLTTLFAEPIHQDIRRIPRKCQADWCHQHWVNLNIVHPRFSCSTTTLVVDNSMTWQDVGEYKTDHVSCFQTVAASTNDALHADWLFCNALPTPCSNWLVPCFLLSVRAVPYGIVDFNDGNFLTTMGW